MRFWQTTCLVILVFSNSQHSSETKAKHEAVLDGNWKPVGTGYTDMFLMIRSRQKQTEMLVVYGGGARYYSNVTIACESMNCDIFDGGKKICALQIITNESLRMVKPPEIKVRQKYGSQKISTFEFVEANTEFKRTENTSFDWPD